MLLKKSSSVGRDELEPEEPDDEVTTEEEGKEKGGEAVETGIYEEEEGEEFLSQIKE